MLVTLNEIPCELLVNSYCLEWDFSNFAAHAVAEFGLKVCHSWFYTVSKRESFDTCGISISV